MTDEAVKRFIASAGTNTSFFSRYVFPDKHPKKMHSIINGRMWRDFYPDELKVLKKEVEEFWIYVMTGRNKDKFKRTAQ